MPIPRRLLWVVELPPPVLLLLESALWCDYTSRSSFLYLVLSLKFLWLVSYWRTFIFESYRKSPITFYVTLSLSSSNKMAGINTLPFEGEACNLTSILAMSHKFDILRKSCPTKYLWHRTFYDRCHTYKVHDKIDESATVHWLTIIMRFFFASAS